MSTDRLSLTFAALADPTRRAILARLASGETSVMKLAEPFAMSLPAVSKHLRVLQRAGLIAQGRKAQWRPCRIVAHPLKDVSDWVERYRGMWERRFDRLDEYLRELQGQQGGLDQPRGKAMAARSEPAAQPAADREIVITRLLDAPRRLVWQAWTDPKHVANWWGPTGFTNTFQTFDVRPGGVWLFVMHGPDGTDYPNRIVFEEVVEPERLVYSHGGGKKDDSVDFHVTVTFAEQDGRTRLTMRSVFPSAAERDRVVREYGAIEGAYQHVDRLAEQLATMQGEFSITRLFDAPRELVWQAWTEPERLARWWGPQGFTMRAVKLDLRPGGVFHYSMQAPPGSPMGNAVLWGKFVYREIVKPERMVFVNSFSDEHGGITRHPISATWPLEVLSTLTFTEHGGKTAVTLRGGPIDATEEERKTFEAGRDSMRQGFTGTFDQLADYLAKA